MSTPAERVIEKFGGTAAVAGHLNLAESWIYRWTYPREKGGTAGVIPTKHQQALLNKARELNLDLKPEDFFDPPEPEGSQLSPPG